MKTCLSLYLRRSEDNSGRAATDDLGFLWAFSDGSCTSAFREPASVPAAATATLVAIDALFGSTVESGGGKGA